MLYTSYIAKINKLPNDIIKVIITRFLPKSLNINKYNNLYTMKELAPSKELLLQYKKDNNWSNYIVNFKKEMNYRKDLHNKINSLYKYLQKGNSVCLICYEKDYLHCHRYLLAQYFMSKGIEWKEL